MSDTIKRQAPARVRSVNELSSDDFRVRIIGTIVSVTPNERLLDDGTGTINVVTDQKLEVGDFIRVIGRVFRKDDSKKDESNLELVAEIIQDMEGLDVDLFNKVKELKNKYSL